MTLYLFEGYSNYYNRTIKKYDTIGEYIAWARDNEKGMYPFGTMNFNPNDDVNTEHVFNLNSGCRPDYVVAVNELGDIVSRWFIIESVRVRGGQYRCTLRRDLVADYYEEIIKAPCFIEKATLTLDDDMIFNSENMTFNQIKKKEYPLSDQTNSAWVVGYINRSLTEKEILMSPRPYYDYAAITLEDFEIYNKYKEDASTCPEAFTNVDYHFYYYYLAGENVNFKKINISGDFTFQNQKNESKDTIFSLSGEATYIECSELARNLYDASRQPDFINPFPSYTSLQDINKYDEKILRVGTATDNYVYYRIRKTSKLVTNENRTLIDGGRNGQLYNIFADWSNYTGSTSDRKGIYATVSYNEYYLNFIDITGQFVNTKFTVSAKRNKLEDAPYDMICTPLNKITLGNVDYNASELGLLAGQELYIQLGGGGENPNIFDVQLLPYCPLNGLEGLVSSGLALSELVEHKDFDYIKEDDTIVSIVFYPTTSSFKNQINIEINNPTDPIEFKINNECDMYRLCSPNYNGVFEFSITKNRGLQYIEINATYKPYNPYIHLNPNWGGLYGEEDFDDQRGLILGGDFSIAALSSAWQQYQLQNKNYEAIFNREIQSMELKNKLGSSQDIVKAITGTITGTVSGAMSGAMMSGGNPYAAAAGGILGGAASLGGGLADISINQQLRTDALDYTKDMYGYNLGNIQALPLSLSKSSAFDINNKQFPFIEYYSSSKIEKEALRNKLKYNGMTVMRIDTIEKFIQPERSYIKGSLIRYENICDDTHILNSISDELYKGVFI